MPYLSFTYLDSYARTSKRLVEVAEQATIAAYEALAGAFVTALQAVTDLGVVRCDLILTAITAGFATTAGANIDTGATFSGILVDKNGEKASLKLPGIKAGLVDADGSVDLTQEAIETFLEFWLSPDGDARLSDGEMIETWLRGALDR